MFGKSDLVNGDILVMRNEQRYVVMKDYGGTGENTFLAINTRGWCDTPSFSENLTCRSNSNFDIMKVLRPMGLYANTIGGHDDSDYKVVYERDESRKKMTVEEIEQRLGYKIAIVDEEGK